MSDQVNIIPLGTELDPNNGFQVNRLMQKYKVGALRIYRGSDVWTIKNDAYANNMVVNIDGNNKVVKSIISIKKDTEGNIFKPLYDWVLTTENPPPIKNRVPASPGGVPQTRADDSWPRAEIVQLDDARPTNGIVTTSNAPKSPEINSLTFPKAGTSEAPILSSGDISNLIGSLFSYKSQYDQARLASEMAKRQSQGERFYLDQRYIQKRLSPWLLLGVGVMAIGLVGFVATRR